MHSPSELARDSGAKRAALRREMRALRRALTERQRDAAARDFARIAKRCRILRPDQRVALYLPFGGEAGTAPLLTLAHALGCEVYLPVVTNYRSKRMRFVRFQANTPLRNNRYGIPEPAQRADFVAVTQLDLIVLPLVAVDARGARIGSGAGFYDRSLRHLSRSRHWKRPRLVGLAYEFQRVATIDCHPWDVPVDSILTEKALYSARQSEAFARTT